MPVAIFLTLAVFVLAPESPEKADLRSFHHRKGFWVPYPLFLGVSVGTRMSSHQAPLTSLNNTDGLSVKWKNHGDFFQGCI